MDNINIIKLQYFSLENIDFIISRIPSNKLKINLNELTFSVMNNIYNIFIHKITITNKTINSNTINELLITLNKMTIESILDKIKQKLENTNTNIINIINNTKTDNIKDNTANSTNDINIKDNTACSTNDITIKDTTAYSTNDITIKDTTTTNSTNDTNSMINKTNYNNTNDTKVHMFSSDDGDFNLDNYSNKNYSKIKFKSLCLYNNFCNISGDNNTIEITENSTKLHIIIPIGNYNLIELLECIENIINNKSTNVYSVKLLKNKINISSAVYFNIKFIENSDSIPLRFLLGFLNNQYINNNNYISDNQAVLNIYDNIYIKINDDINFNIYNCKNLKYFKKIRMDCQNTFGQTIDFTCIDNICFNLNTNMLCFEFYYRHNIHNKFYKIESIVHFDFIIELS